MSGTGSRLGRWVQRYSWRAAPQPHTVAEPQLSNHGPLLKAVTESATRLLNADNLDDAITEALAALGPTLGISRIMMTEMIVGANERFWVAPKYEWFRPGMISLKDHPGFRKFEITFAYSMEKFKKTYAGEAEIHFASDFPEEMRTLCEKVGMRSIISLSVMRDGKMYGDVNFCDDSVVKRTWGTAEIDTLRTLCGLVGAAMTRARHLKERGQAMTGMLLRDRALESISQGITITDDTAPGSPIIYTNPAFAALTRYTSEEIVGRGPLSFFDAEIATRVGERIAHAHTEKRPWRLECSLKRKDGTAFLDSMASSVIVDENGKVSHSVTVHEDVTELRQREELLMEAQRMESVGQLTGGIAHDFNNLLTAIKSNAEDLRDDLKDNPFLLSQAKIVLEAADRGAKLVAQLMAFARKQELQPKVVDVNELVSSISKLIHGTLPANIEIEVRETTPLHSVFVDPIRFETALLNLALNARDAMPTGGALTVETMVKTLDADYVAEHLEVKQGRYVLIAVTDTGTGMPQNVIDRAFVPFFTTKEVGKGTGLGLSMVYGFVKQSGGHVKIYSEMGLGTVIKIYLPALDQVANPENQTASDGTAVAGVGSILLVEDDTIVRHSISNKLARLGYSVTTASTALEAIDILKGNANFDLAFSDVIMPGPMNGADLVREVRRRWPAMKVLLTSGYTESTVLGKVNLPTDVRLLSKPYSNTELAQVISEVIGTTVKPR